MRSTIAAGCYSDHILITRAYGSWQQSKKNGTDSTFVRDSFLHHGTLNMMEGGCRFPSSVHSLTPCLPSLIPSFLPFLPLLPPLILSLPPFCSLFSIPSAMASGLRRQFTSHLLELGLKDLDQYNEHSSSDPMIRAILTAGLQPNVMKLAKMMESGGHRGHGDSIRKRVRSGFKTM